MERIEAELLKLDRSKLGKIAISTFERIMGEQTDLQKAHIDYLIQAAGRCLMCYCVFMRPSGTRAISLFHKSDVL